MSLQNNTTGLQAILAAVNALPEAEETPETTYDEPETMGQRACLARAKQFAKLTYTIPTGTKTGLGLPVSNAPDSYYPEGTTVTGLMYSSTRKTDLFVGYNISLYTFMTAIHNPRSVLYQTAAAGEAANGTNAYTWYGNNCSSFVSYAHDWMYHSATNIIPDLPHISEITNVDDMRLCDILDSSNDHGGTAKHCILVTGITRDKNGAVTHVEITEATRPLSRTITITRANLVNVYMGTNGYKIYRSSLLYQAAYKASPFVRAFEDEPVESIVYSNLCPDRGDKCVIRVGEDVTLNVLNNTSHASIKVSRNGVTYGTYTTTNNDVTIADMTAGRYDAVLCDADGNPLENGYASWIVADVTASRKGDRYYFSGDGKPLRVVLKDSAGYTLEVYDLTDDDAAQTYKDITYEGSTTPGTVCVPFAYDYGMITAVFSWATESVPEDETAPETSLLPTEYQQVEYIATDGNQYIDTGVMASNYSGGITYTMRGNVTGIKNTSGNNYWFGCLANSSRSGNVSAYGTTSLRVYIGGASSAAGQLAGSPVVTGADFDLLLTCSSALKQATFEYNGTTIPVAEANITTSAMPAANIHLFTANGVAATNGKYYGKCYSFTMADASGNAIRNFVPCYRKSDSVVGLYDTVSDTFFTNAGTGSFTAGPEV